MWLEYWQRLSESPKGLPSSEIRAGPKKLQITCQGVLQALSWGWKLKISSLVEKLDSDLEYFRIENTKLWKSRECVDQSHDSELWTDTQNVTPYILPFPFLERYLSTYNGVSDNVVNIFTTIRLTRKRSSPYSIKTKPGRGNCCAGSRNCSVCYSEAIASRHYQKF